MCACSTSTVARSVTQRLRQSVLLSVLLLTIATGCHSRVGVNTEYGKVTGTSGGTSVNGTNIFFGMFEERGFETRRYKRISPRIRRYETVVWFPGRQNVPSDRAIEVLEQWLDEGYSRTIIYVARDFDAEIQFYQRMTETAEAEDADEVRRLLAEAKIRQDRRLTYFADNDDPEVSDWFEHAYDRRQKANSLSGPLAEGVDASASGVEFATRLIPPQDPAEERERAATTLLSANEVEFVYALHRGEDGDTDLSRENKIIVVSNGSFLLNFALVNKENRKLAGNLIDQCDQSSVVFLESGRGDIEISDRESLNHNAWAWIAQPPLCFIMPHFLLWGVIFCFVFYPIFGRPRRLQNHKNVSFLDHIIAMGKLMQRTRDVDEAMDKISRYQETNSRDSRASKE